MSPTTLEPSVLFTQLPIALFLVVTLVFIFFSLSLVYHVRQYSLNQKRAQRALLLYTLVSGALIIVAALALYSIS